MLLEFIPCIRVYRYLIDYVGFHFSDKVDSFFLSDWLYSVEICHRCVDFKYYDAQKYGELETVSITEPLQNWQHARKTPNAVDTRREGELKGRREEEGN